MTEIAAVAQATILRPVPSQVAGPQPRLALPVGECRLAGRRRPVRRARLGAHARVLIGDVRGKGLAAVQLAAAVLSAFRVQGASERSLPDLAEQLERAAAPGMTGEDFVTVLLCDLWPGGRLARGLLRPPAAAGAGAG